MSEETRLHKQTPELPRGTSLRFRAPDRVVRADCGPPSASGAPPTSHLHDSILSTVGGTPVVRLRRLSPPGRTIWAKLESFNPLGSVKDRLAIGVLEDAERRGQLSPGQTVVEATSGNTGLLPGRLHPR